MRTDRHDMLRRAGIVWASSMLTIIVFVLFVWLVVWMDRYYNEETMGHIANWVIGFVLTIFGLILIDDIRIYIKTGVWNK